MALNPEELKAIKEILQEEIKPLADGIHNTQLQLTTIDLRLQQIDLRLQRIEKFVPSENADLVPPIKKQRQTA